MSLDQEGLGEGKTKSNSRSSKGSTRRTRKQKRLSISQLRMHLLNKPGGGWTSKMVDNPQKTKVGNHEYSVTLADRYEILKQHRKELVEPLLKGTGIKVKIDKKSFIEQEEAYDGEKTDVVYEFVIPKRAQKWLKEKSKREMGTHWYSNYLEKKHGEQFMQDYWNAEQKALEKTFGRKGADLAEKNEEVWSDEWDSEYVGIQVWNEWNLPDWMN